MLLATCSFVLIFRGNYVLTFRYRLPAVVKAVLKWLSSDIYLGSLRDVFLSCLASYELFSVGGYRIKLIFVLKVHPRRLLSVFVRSRRHGFDEIGQNVSFVKLWLRGGVNGNIPSFAFHNTHTVISETVFYFFESLSLRLCHFLPLGGRVF